MKTGGIHLPSLFRKGTTTLQLQRFGIFQFRGFSNSETELRDAKKCMISYRRHTSLIGEKRQNRVAIRPFARYTVFYLPTQGKEY